MVQDNLETCSCSQMAMAKNSTRVSVRPTAKMPVRLCAEVVQVAHAASHHFALIAVPNDWVFVSVPMLSWALTPVLQDWMATDSVVKDLIDL